MGKYTNAWFYKKDNHDCANDGTCGQSITDFRIGDSKISFHDNHGRTIAQIPKLPNGNSFTYYNNLYKTAQSRNFGENTKYVGVLYKDAYTDNVLAHEFGHVFQFKLSEAKVEELDRINNQLMANAIGLEVEEKNYKAICKQMGVDEYKDHGSMFQFKYKDTTGSIYLKDLSEEEKFQIIQRVKNSGLDEYEDRGWMFQFKYKDTTYSIYRKDLSEEEKFQIIQHVKNSGLDEYEDRGSMFQFKYKGTLYKYHKNLSEEEKFKAIQNVKNIHELVDEYKDHGSMFSFKYKGTTYNVKCEYFSEKEKLQFIKDIKNSHESLISECDGLNEGPLSQNATVVISIDENKEISRMYFHNPDKNMSEWLDKTLISRSKSEEDVDDTDPKPGKEPEPESGKESKEDISRSKPEQEVEKSNEVEQSNVDVEEEKSNQQDTQQPSNFLGSVK